MDPSQGLGWPIASAFTGGLVVFGFQQLVAWWRRPVLAVEFGPDDGCAARTPGIRIKGGESDYDGIYLRARIRNSGRSAAKNCRGYLMALAANPPGSPRKTFDNFDPIPLPWSLTRAKDGEPQVTIVDLPAGMHQYADIFFVVSRPAPLKLFPATEQFPPRYRALIDLPGRFEATILAVADGSNMAKRQIKFQWDGPWDTLRPIA